MIRKSLAALAFTAVVLIAFPSVSGAHVEVTANGSPDAEDVLTVSVFAENECASDGNLGSVELVFPEAPELTTVVADSGAGWTAAVTKHAGSEAVEKIVWTNTGDIAGDGQYPIAIGPIATDEEPIEFKAIDTCVDGTVTRWVQEGEGSEYPAPILAISHDGHTDEHEHEHEEATDTSASADTDSESDDSSSTGIIVGIAAAVVVIGGGAAILLIRRNKPAASE